MYKLQCTWKHVHVHGNMETLPCHVHGNTSTATHFAHTHTRHTSSKTRHIHTTGIVATAAAAYSTACCSYNRCTTQLLLPQCASLPCCPTYDNRESEREKGETMNPPCAAWATPLVPIKTPAVTQVHITQHPSALCCYCCCVEFLCDLSVCSRCNTACPAPPSFAAAVHRPSHCCCWWPSHCCKHTA